MQWTSCLTIICLLQILSDGNATKGKYTVIAPGTIHCNEKYTAAVAVHHTTQPCQIKIGIMGPFYNVTQQIKVSQNKVKNVEFVLPCLKKGNYILTAEAIDCLDNFKNSTKLIYNKFNKHVIIHTDKDFYAPGDDINFRVLFLDKDLRPARPNRDALIWIADGKSNRIKEIKDFNTTKGVYTGKLKISEYPVTGGWHLGVRNGDTFDHTLHFEVDKHDVPKFLVEVETTKSVSVKEGEMQVIVRAKYNYGKPLDGKVTVVLFLESYNYYEPSMNNYTESPKLSKTANIVKGKAKLDFNIQEYDAYIPYENSNFYVIVLAMVEDKLTGVQINSTASATMYRYRYAINCINYDAFATFEVNKEKDLLFQITYVDGSYVNDTKSTVELTCQEVLRKNNGWHDSVMPPSSENHAVTVKGHLNETGFVTFTVALPNLPQYEGYLHYYSLELKYLDELHELCYTHLYSGHKKVNSPKREEEEEEMDYFILEDKFWSGNKVYLKKASKFALNSSRPLSYFDYNVIGRGNILKSGRIILPDKPKLYNLTLTPRFSWVPNFCVYVNYVDEKGEYHFAEQPYEVVFELKNQINITVAQQGKPGEEVALKIQTAPNSFVGLMAVDQSSFLKNTKTDFNFNELKKLLGSYNTYTNPHGGYSKYPGEISGCVILTSADYFFSRSRSKNMDHKLMLASNKYATMYSTASEARVDTNMEPPQGISKTWLFTDIENTEAAEFMWRIKIPETINTWVLTAFSLNPHEGLAVTREQTNITTFQPFFITVRLPYSIKRGEVINVPACVFNYLDEALDVEVTLDNSDKEYEFIKFDNAVIYERKLTKGIRVPANEATCVSFLVKPKVVGNVTLKFTAISAVAGDSIHKSMKVIAEGITQYTNRACWVNLEKGSEFKSFFVLELPEDVVPDTERVEVGVMADILGPALNNINNLMRLPTGCGEHSMSTLISTALAMKYLKNSKRLTLTMQTELSYNLEISYQNMLYYRHNDGSFSSFGPAQIKEKPPNGSIWLTAYLVRSLQQIKEFISVDSKIIEDGLAYLSKQQVENGTFTENGDYLYAAERNHVTLTCAAILAILENATNAEKYSEELKKGLNFIAQNIDTSDSLLAQALGTFTLNRAKHAAAADNVTKLRALARTGFDRTWLSAKKQQCGSRWWYNVFRNDVQITSYALLTFLDKYCTKIDDMLPIINWLIAQRNSKGGFATIQDTVAGLNALMEFATFAEYEPAKMTVDIESKEKNETIYLTEVNRILYQKIEMPPKSKLVTFTAKGTGSVLVQIAYQYNVLEKDPNPSFLIKISKINNTNTPLRLHLLVCVYYVGEGDSSNMALLEITTPSGYVIDDESSKEITELRRVSSTELKYSDTLLVVYFDHLYKNYETCFLVQAIRTHAVAMQKPASVVLYDYYNTGRRATAFYEVESNLCDICETEEECSKCK